MTTASGDPGSESSATEWVRRFAEALGVTPPTDDEVADLLAMAGVAAHASERTAAPLSAWLAGRAGAAPSAARAAAERLAATFGPGRQAGTRARGRTSGDRGSGTAPDQAAGTAPDQAAGTVSDQAAGTVSDVRLRLP